MKNEPRIEAVRFLLKDELARTMNRQQYKATMRWLRLAAREVRKEFNTVDVPAIMVDLITKGVTVL